MNKKKIREYIIKRQAKGKKKQKEKQSRRETEPINIEANYSTQRKKATKKKQCDEMQVGLGV